MFNDFEIEEFCMLSLTIALIYFMFSMTCILSELVEKS